MSFFFGQSKQRDYLVLDIGKEAVKALILKRQKEEVELLSSALEYFDDHNVSTINEEEIIEHFENNPSRGEITLIIH